MKVVAEFLPSSRNCTYFYRKYDETGFQSSRHYHDEFELAYIERGSGKVLGGNSVSTFQRGDVFLFAPRYIHAFKLKEVKTAICHVVLFPSTFLGQDFLSMPDSDGLRRLMELASNGVRFSSTNAATRKKIIGLGSARGLRSVVALLDVMAQLTAHSQKSCLCSDISNKYYFKHDDQKMARLLEFIHNNIATVTFSEVVKFSGLQPSAFARLFKSKTERRFSDYVNELRIESSKNDLINTSTNIGSISNNYGFKNLSYFNRVFKKIEGVTPSYFRHSYSSFERSR